MEESRKQQLLDILNGPYFRIEKTTEESLALYDIALTHSSFAHERKQQGMECEDNERLEFLGNYFLEYVVACYLRSLKKYDPGEMNKRLRVTKNENLSDIVLKYNLRIDEAINFRGGKKPTMKMTANAFEAFIGAIHCAEGIDKARDVILGIFVEDLKTFDPESNYKGRLQEYVAQHSLGDLKYPPPNECPGHKKGWKATVCLNGEDIEDGIGFTKKRAEMDAARKALRKLNAE